MCATLAFATLTLTSTLAFAQTKTPATPVEDNPGGTATYSSDGTALISCATCAPARPVTLAMVAPGVTNRDEIRPPQAQQANPAGAGQSGNAEKTPRK